MFARLERREMSRLPIPTYSNPFSFPHLWAKEDRSVQTLQTWVFEAYLCCWCSLHLRPRSICIRWPGWAFWSSQPVSDILTGVWYFGWQKFGQDGRIMLWSSTSKKPLATSSLGAILYGNSGDPAGPEGSKTARQTFLGETLCHMSFEPMRITESSEKFGAVRRWKVGGFPISWILDGSHVPLTCHTVLHRPPCPWSSGLVWFRLDVFTFRSRRSCLGVVSFGLENTV